LIETMNIWALMHNRRMAVSHRECQDGPKITARNASNRIVVEAIYVNDVAGEGGELNNVRTDRGGREDHPQRVGSSRFHDAFVAAIQLMSARTKTE
jgi:hypothetical protein